MAGRTLVENAKVDIYGLLSGYFVYLWELGFICQAAGIYIHYVSTKLTSVVSIFVYWVSQMSFRMFSAEDSEIRHQSILTHPVRLRRKHRVRVIKRMSPV